MKRVLTLVLIAALMVSFIGCGDKKDENLTIAGNLMEAFKANAKTTDDLAELAHKMIDGNDAVYFDADVMEITEGYLNGFSDEVTGFGKGVFVGPFIGSIPFVAYIFETDDTAALEKKLTDLHQLNWNICTEADEMMVDHVDNKVFFVMAPFSAEE